MNIYAICDSDGKVSAFEIENAYVGIGKIASLLKTTDSISNVRRRKLFSAQSEIHIEFQYKGQEFIVWEPYGDNSRYWIGPKSEVLPAGIDELMQLFLKYQPPLLIKAIGDLISIKFRH